MSLKTSSRLNRLILGVSVTITLALVHSRLLPADDRIDDVMYQDPAFPEETTSVKFRESLKPLWLEALNRPESELQRMAADTIALAHRAGMTGLHDASERLIELVNNDDTVRNAAARALVAIDAQSSASAFRRAMKNASLELTIIIEPALASWNDSLASETWRERMNDVSTERARLLLAIECLGAVGDAKAAPALLKIVADAHAALPIRLAAAKAVKRINVGDILSTAENLATGIETNQQSSCLLAATLLGSQTSTTATSLLKEWGMVRYIRTNECDCARQNERGLSTQDVTSVCERRT